MLSLKIEPFPKFPICSFSIFPNGFIGLSTLPCHGLVDTGAESGVCVASGTFNSCKQRRSSRSTTSGRYPANGVQPSGKSLKNRPATCTGHVEADFLHQHILRTTDPPLRVRLAVVQWRWPRIMGVGRRTRG